jgi:hypothetical protein
VQSTALALSIADEELQAIEKEVKRRQYRADPVLWAKERLGVTLWSGQRRILESVRDNRKTAVMSCHEIGKSFIAGVVVGWWIDTRPLGDSFVVTSAPTGPQVANILWKEIGRVHSKGGLAGRLNQTEWYVTPPGTKEELAAMGRKPSDYDHTAFQGLHARYMLYVFDESCGMPPDLWTAADSLIANDFSKGFAIGNPDDPTSEFANICKPGSGWNVIQIGAFDTPNFTEEDIPLEIKQNLVGKIYVEDMRRKWAPNWYWKDDYSAVIPPPGADEYNTNPFWQSKVLGRFPRIGTEHGLIPAQWIERAKRKNLTGAIVKKRLGVDVGGGGDATTIAEVQQFSETDFPDFRVRIKSEDHNPDTMQTAGNVIFWLRETAAEEARVDTIGIGRGVCDRVKEQNKPARALNVGQNPQGGILKIIKQGVERWMTEDDAKEHFVNLRAELWWYVRTLFEYDCIDIDERDEDLAGQLVELRFKRTSTGKVQIESKDEAVRRGVPSPNRADSLMLGVAKLKDPPSKATWGRR